MTEVKMPRDDATLVINPKATPNRSVQPAEPAPTVHPVQPHEEAKVAPKVAPRRQQKRRQGERRKKDQPILLDTRSGKDRRGNEQTDDPEEGQERKGPGIDVFV